MSLFNNIFIFFFCISSIFCSVNSPSNCKIVFKNTANHLSDVYQCLLKSVADKNVCLSCVNKYQLFSNEFNKLQNNVKANNGLNCLKVIEKSKDYKIFSALVHNATKMWTSSNCPSCFKDHFNISGDDFEYQNILQEFIIHHSKLVNCLQPYTTLKISLCDVIDFPTNRTFNSSACNTCQSQYTAMFKSYTNIRTQFNDDICEDIESLFNCAHNAIESYFKCYNSQPSFINCWPLVTLLGATLIFYSCTTVFRNKPHIQIYNQSRVMPCHPSDGASMFGGSINSHIQHSQSINANVNLFDKDNCLDDSSETCPSKDLFLTVPNFSRNNYVRY